MKPPLFKYIKAENVEATLATLGEHGEDAKILAGGQSLVPMLNFRIAEPAVLVDINPVSELDYISLENDVILIGARTRQRSLEFSPEIKQKCPILAEATKWIGHAQIRNRGTVGGSLVHGDPTSELALIMTLLDTTLVIEGQSKTRTSLASDFFESFMTTKIAPDELLKEIRIPTKKSNSGFGFRELCIRHGDFAVVAAAALIRTDGNGKCIDARVAVSGAGPAPFRLKGAEKTLGGETGSEKNLNDAANTVPEEVNPIPDLKGNESYKRAMAKEFVRRALKDAWNMVREIGKDGRNISD